MSFGDWEDRSFLLDTPYLDGEFLDRGFPEGVDWNSPSGLRAAKALAANHKVWRPFTETKAPRDMQGISATISRYRVTEDDYMHLMEVMRKAEIVFYADGRPAEDKYPGATAGESKLLTRPLADGIVPGLNTSLYPTKVYLDGVDTPAAATVSGQDVTINSSGDVRIVYTPAYRVILTDQGWRIGGYNDLTTDAINMIEVVQGTFHS